MQVCEYSRENSRGHLFETLEGRWHYEFVEQSVGEFFWSTTFIWTDLFGKEEQV
jgi:hypothetical protein